MNNFVSNPITSYYCFTFEYVNSEYDITFTIRYYYQWGALVYN